MEDVILTKRNRLSLCRQDLGTALFNAFLIVGMRVHKRFDHNSKDSSSHRLRVVSQPVDVPHTGSRKEDCEVAKRLARPKVRHVRPDTTRGAADQTGETDTIREHIEIAPDIQMARQGREDRASLVKKAVGQRTAV